MSILIGITCGWREGEKRHLVHDEYVRAVMAAGGLPLLIPTLEIEGIEKVYELFDGFILSGGDDVDPLFFGEEPQEGLGEITPCRDQFELALAQRALQGNKPILAICRGIQVLNIAAGGSVYQDLKGVTSQAHKQLAPRWYPTHWVEVEKNSRLYEVVGDTSIRVNSFHHQGLNQIAEDLRIVAISRDGLVEAVEAKDQEKWIMGVQWHPECCWHRDKSSLNLFQKFVQAATIRLKAAG